MAGKFDQSFKISEDWWIDNTFLSTIFELLSDNQPSIIVEMLCHKRFLLNALRILKMINWLMYRTWLPVML